MMQYALYESISVVSKVADKKVNKHVKEPKEGEGGETATQSCPAVPHTFLNASKLYTSATPESDDILLNEVEPLTVIQENGEYTRSAAAQFLLDPDSTIDLESKSRIEALLQAADEAAAALTRMRSDNSSIPAEKTSLVEACADGDVRTVRKLLTEGRSVHETSEDGESLLSLACSAGYYELAQVLLAMHANVEDRGIKGECTPLMEAASSGHLEIVKLLVKHEADVNAQSTSGNTPLMYGCAGGHEAVVLFLLENGANVEDHNENGHTPLMEAASAGYVNLAKILLEHGAGINTHSNEFKESALTLACYKGHLDMVRFLLEAGADQEHKTDEMHTALMEASMDGHVEVARLLLDSGAQVNMPTDSFESPLTLAACGGHVDLAMLLIERGANIEEVNDEGYTPLMEAAREGHEEMVHLLLSQGANINAQTDETQETALTLACCGGFTEVTDILLKSGADLELGASTPLMEAAQEGRLELVKFLLDNGASVHAQTQTSDTALTYACENGHTDVADLLLQYGSDLEHESEGGRTPLMKACRAGHLCTVQFLIVKGADLRRQTTSNDHTALSLACAGGHLPVVELLLAHNADVNHKLKDNSTMIIEAAKGGHTSVVQLLLDYPHSLVLNQQQPISVPSAVQPVTGSHTATQPSINLDQNTVQDVLATPTPIATSLPLHERPTRFFPVPPLPSATCSLPPTAANTSVTAGPATVQVPEVRILSQQQLQAPHMQQPKDDATTPAPPPSPQNLTGSSDDPPPSLLFRELLAKCQAPGAAIRGGRSARLNLFERAMALSDAQKPRVSVNNQSFNDIDENDVIELLNKDEASLIDYLKSKQKLVSDSLSETETTIHLSPNSTSTVDESVSDEGTTQKQQILEELHRVERELNGKQLLPSQFLPYANTIEDTQSNSDIDSNAPQTRLINLNMVIQEPSSAGNKSCIQTGSIRVLTPAELSKGPPNKSAFVSPNAQVPQYALPQPTSFYFSRSPATPGTSCALNSTASVTTTPATMQTQAIKFSPNSKTSESVSTVASHNEVSQNTAISDRPKAKPVSKKEGKNLRKQQHPQKQLPTISYQAPNVFGSTDQMCNSIELQQQLVDSEGKPLLTMPDTLDIDAIDKEFILKTDPTDNIITAAFLQQLHSTSLRTAFYSSPSNTPMENVRLEINQQHHHLLHQPHLGGNAKDKLSSTGKLELELMNDKEFAANVNDVVQTLESQLNAPISNQTNNLQDDNLVDTSNTNVLDEAMLASFSNVSLNSPQSQNDQQFKYGDMSSVNQKTHMEYYAKMQMPNNVHAFYQAGFQAGINLMQQQLAYPACSVTDQSPQSTTSQPGMSTIQQQTTSTNTSLPQCNHVTVTGHHCQVPCSQHHHHHHHHHAHHGHLQQSQTPPPAVHQQVQVATQTGQNSIATATECQIVPDQSITVKKMSSIVDGSTMLPNAISAAVPLSAKSIPAEHIAGKIKKGRVVRHVNPSIPQLPHGTFPVEHHHHHAVSNGATTANTTTIASQSTATSTSTTATSASPSPSAPSSMTVSVVSTSTSTCLDVDSETESNHDTALTLACAGGHEDLVELLLNRGADIEHRDKKGFTPLILAATAGHEKVVDILLNHNADIEAQSERTKDTPLSLACSGGRYEVVEFLLNRNANKEHRNVSDYTPLSLAASGGYVNIIKLLLSHGAEINSRTGSKLGISPLMLAAMNGHTAAVKLLLDMGSDINAQIETNRNTALTLACFQGRHEVVSLLLDRKANVEHRAKTGLTPLMEAASGGYVEVGRVLLDKGADVNATPVPSSRDTALTIAADKGHVRFVELLLCRGAQIEVKNKKGNSPLWLAANGGHLAVVELLFNINANIDSQDNRKVSCLMAAFRKGHIKVVKWMVLHVTQFPSDQEMVRYLATVNDKDLLDKCQECVKIIRAAKETQAAKANKNASILLEELDMEKNREVNKRLAAARRRERKKQKKLEKKEERRKLMKDSGKNENENSDADDYEEPVKKGSHDSKSKISNDKCKQYSRDDEEDEDDDDDDDDEDIEEEKTEEVEQHQVHKTSTRQSTADGADKEEGDSGIDANSQGSCSSNDIKPNDKRKDKKKKKPTTTTKNSLNQQLVATIKPTSNKSNDSVVPTTSAKRETNLSKPKAASPNVRRGLIFEPSNKSPAERDDFEATGNENYTTSNKNKRSTFESHASDVTNSNPNKSNNCTPSKSHQSSNSQLTTSNKREDGWKEVVRKSSVQTVSSSESGIKKVSVPLNAISRVIGRAGSNINAIRGATGAHIEVEKQSKGQGERIITIKGSVETTKQAHMLIATLIKDPDVDILQMLSKNNKSSSVLASNISLWDKTQLGTKKASGKMISQSTSSISNTFKSSVGHQMPTSSVPPLMSTAIVPSSLRAHTKARGIPSLASRSLARPNTSTTTTMQQPSKIIQNPNALANRNTNTSNAPSPKSFPSSQTFAAKLIETVTSTGTICNSQSMAPQNKGTRQHSHLIQSSTGSTVQPLMPLATTIVTNSNQMPQNHVNVTSTANASPRHCRPAPTASAPPTMQSLSHGCNTSQTQQNSISPARVLYGSSNFNDVFANSTETTVPTDSVTALPTSAMNLATSASITSACMMTYSHTDSSHSRCVTPNFSQAATPSHNKQGSPFHFNSQESNSNTFSDIKALCVESQQTTISQPSEYSLFYSGDQQPMWKRVRNDNESQQLINGKNLTNFSTVGVNSSASIISLNNTMNNTLAAMSVSSLSPSKFLLDAEPTTIADITKAPGYRGTVSNNNLHTVSCNSTNQRNTTSVASTSGANSSVFQPQQLFGPSKNDSSNFYSELFLNAPPQTQQAQLSHLVHHPPPNVSTQPTMPNHFNVNYGNQSGAGPSLVTMSRLNPKAPDFATTTTVANKHPALYGNCSLNATPTPNLIPTVSTSNHNANTITTPSNNIDFNQGRWNVMHAPPPFSQQFPSQQSDFSAITGLTIHNLAARVADHMLSDTSIVGSNGSVSDTLLSSSSASPTPSHPNLSPTNGHHHHSTIHQHNNMHNMQGASALHNAYVGLPPPPPPLPPQQQSINDDALHTGPKPQPIGTERHRKIMSTANQAPSAATITITTTSSTSTTLHDLDCILRSSSAASISTQQQPQHTSSAPSQQQLQQQMPSNIIGMTQQNQHNAPPNACWLFGGVETVNVGKNTITNGSNTNSNGCGNTPLGTMMGSASRWPTGVSAAAAVAAASAVSTSIPPPTIQGDRYGNGSRYVDDMPPILQETLQTHLPSMDGSHGYANGGAGVHPYMMLQQPMTNIRPYDYIPMMESLKMDFSWENAAAAAAAAVVPMVNRSNLNEIPDKTHGWNGMINKWNQ